MIQENRYQTIENHNKTSLQLLFSIRESTDEIKSGNAMYFIQ